MVKQKRKKIKVCQNCNGTEAELGSNEFEELDFKGSGEWICKGCADNLRIDCDKRRKYNGE